MIVKLKKSFKFLIIAVIILIIGFAVYQKFTSPQNSKKILSEKVKRGKLEKTLTISGKIAAEENITLRFQTSGRVVWVGVKEGDYVKKYQSIASLDQRELKKKLQKYLDDFMKTRHDYDQTNREEYRYVAMDNEIDWIMQKSELDLNKAVLDVELQTIAMEYANLWTPIEGIVTKAIPAFAGADTTLTNPAQYEIVNPNSIYFSATADQSEVKDLYENLTGNLILDGFPEETVNGYIKSISFTPKEGESGTVYEVKFIFPNYNSANRYKMGMTGDLTMVLKEKDNVLYIPISYLKEENGKKYLNIKKNNKEDKAYIETGMETDDYIEIASGVAENEIVYD